MPAIPLPENPSLEHLENQAKLVHDLVAEGDEGALDLVEEFHPRLTADAATAAFTLSDAQLVVARLYGFTRWTKLRDHLGVVEAASWPDDGVAEDAEDSDRFVVLACVTYSADNPGERIDRARRMLANDLSLATASPAAMAVTGDHQALAERLDAGEIGIDEPCGPNRWPPLLYCAYSRIEPDHGIGRSTLAAARLLLERGADPNAGFLWRGLVPPFTALTGAFGRGEQDQPPHPDSTALARLLLEAAADPNDGQALYNNGLAGTAHDDPTHLELLVEFGLGTDRGGPWYRRLGDRLTPPAELLYDELEVAASRGLPDRMRFLIGLGRTGDGPGSEREPLDLDRPVGRSGRPPARLAAAGGFTEVLQQLAEAGVDTALTPVERFLGVARAGTATELHRLIDADPTLVEAVRAERPGIVEEMAEPGRLEVIRALVELGFDVDARAGASQTTALHKAARAGDVGLARTLVELGADPTLTDPTFEATPLGWAHHFQRADVIAYLESVMPGGGG